MVFYRVMVTPVESIFTEFSVKKPRAVKKMTSADAEKNCLIPNDLGEQKGS